ncbi:MAG: GNAT family N-acetyltransferase [Halioglobus sp.]|nr:GNAT family N-acetyltransferase [Halioglobus sp.]
MVYDNSSIRVDALSLDEVRADPVLQAALANAGKGHVQRDPDWLANIALNALEPGEEAVFMTARGAADDPAILPLKLNRAGGRAEALGNFYTSDWAPVLPRQNGAVLLHALCAALAANKDVAELRLAPLREDSAALPLLQDALEDTGWLARHEYLCFGNWSHNTDGADFNDYLAQRPSQLRNTLRRRTRQFREAGGTLQLVTGAAELAEALASFTEVYQASWKRPEPYPDFIPGLAAVAATRGWLRLGVARRDGRAVAAQMWLVANATAYIFKLAYREDAAAYSPGTVLTGFMLQEAIDKDRVAVIDYLSGDDAYKRDWMSTRREYRGIAAYNGRRLAGRGRALVHQLKTGVKRLRSLR